MEGPGFDREVTEEKSILILKYEFRYWKKIKIKHIVVVDDIPVDMINRYKFVNW